MSIVKTTEEFSTRRKIRYGGLGSSSSSSSSSPVSVSTLGAKQYTMTPSSTNANLSPHKNYYGKDQDDKRAYFIEFNIGDFDFNDITIRTEGHRLIVQGKTDVKGDAEEFSREFKRDFTLPKDVDQYSIRAQLEEDTRVLSLIGEVVEKLESAHQLSGANEWANAKVGAVREKRTGGNALEYEIYLGPDLRDGQATIELAGFNSLNARVIKNNWDNFGDFSLELKRQIKLPSGANSQQIGHSVDLNRQTLVVKVPLK